MANSTWSRLTRHKDMNKGNATTLVVSPDPINAVTRVHIVVPITSGGGFARNAGFAVFLISAGTQTTGVIRCDPPRPIDLEARHARGLESV